MIVYPSELSSAAIRSLIGSASDDVIFVGDARYQIEFTSRARDRMIETLRAWNAGLVFSDGVDRPRADYQFGSIRDDFDFGPVVALSVPWARQALDRYDSGEAFAWGGLYDLRLKLSMDAPIVRIPEPLYASTDPDRRTSSEKHFDYVDPAARAYQAEMEQIATAHLRRIGAYLPAREQNSPGGTAFPVEASVVIPVRNRDRTIGDAIRSALDQVSDFRFNVIVVNNHSVDRTSEVIAAVEDDRLIPIVPIRTDLGIGGCWQEALESNRCGRYALQLDSDDLFEATDVLARVVETMRTEQVAMLVGSYTTVDFSLNTIAPGLVDHAEWTAENGHNNALRVNGFGAPRAYDVSVVRRLGFPNVSYGEDYAMGLRVSREYRIGRIFDSLYLCRRWEGNTDSAPTVNQVNRFNAYKDWLRTAEIRARVVLNGREG